MYYVNKWDFCPPLQNAKKCIAKSLYACVFLFFSWRGEINNGEVRFREDLAWSIAGYSFLRTNIDRYKAGDRGNNPMFFRGPQPQSDPEGPIRRIYFFLEYENR